VTPPNQLTSLLGSLLSGAPAPTNFPTRITVQTYPLELRTYSSRTFSRRVHTHTLTASSSLIPPSYGRVQRTPNLPKPTLRSTPKYNKTLSALEQIHPLRNKPTSFYLTSLNTPALRLWPALETTCLLG
jgi:hypothetical protein